MKPFSWNKVQPLVFGAQKNKGVRLMAYRPEVV